MKTPVEWSSTVTTRSGATSSVVVADAALLPTLGSGPEPPSSATLANSPIVSVPAAIGAVGTTAKTADAAGPNGTGPMPRTQTVPADVAGQSQPEVLPAAEKTVLAGTVAVSMTPRAAAPDVASW